jgi:hypothetical protein
MDRHPNGHFKKGNGGRPAGARNKLQAKFVEALAKDFEEHGAGIINIVRIEQPATYLKIIASVLPKEFQIGATPVDDLTEEETAAALETIRQIREQKAA